MKFSFQNFTKTHTLLLVSLMAPVLLSAQDDIHAISNLFCDCLKNHSSLKSNQLLEKCGQEVSYKFLDSADATDKSETKALRLEVELQKNCKEYQDLISSLGPDNGSINILEQNPNSNLKKEESRAIERMNELYYLEQDGAKTFVTIENGIWRENILNGTHSATMSLIWTSESDFTLKFIDSTDPERLSYSNRGDEYYYRVIDKTDTFFFLTIKSEESVGQFKLYYKK